MPSYQPGQIVLITFPYSDASGSKRRPALMLFDAGDNDILAARITSHPARPPTDIALIGLGQEALVLPSVVRIHKLATLSKRLIDHPLGVLTASDWTRVRQALRQLWNSI